MLPHTLRLDQTLQSILPISVYFITLGASVLVAVMAAASNNVQEVSGQALERLLAMADTYLLVLSTLLSEHGKFTSLFVHAVHDILSQCRQHFHQRESSFIDLAGLFRFRWVGSGTGVMALSTIGAETLWSSSAQHQSLRLDMGLAAPRNSTQEATHWEAIGHLLDPQSRLCQPGFFDLSVSLNTT